MIKAAGTFRFFRSLLFFILCISVSFGILTLTAKDTSAYVVSVSDTCENVFISDGKQEIHETEKPEEPSDQTSAPTTGDRNPVEWVLSVALVCVAVLIIIGVWSQKEDGRKEDEK